MAEQQPSIGRIVHYQLSENDIEQINRRRTYGASIHGRMEENAWPVGAQAHIGNHQQAGDVVPLVIVRVWPDEGGVGIPGVNGQALLDGNDVLWVTSAHEGTEPGQWQWPPRV
jgi:hypothetical protein